jgi:hypothetical protein
MFGGEITSLNVLLGCFGSPLFLSREFQPLSWSNPSSLIYHKYSIKKLSYERTRQGE